METCETRETATYGSRSEPGEGREARGSEDVGEFEDV